MTLQHDSTPVSDRGVQRTEKQGSQRALNACVDWLQVTFKNQTKLNKIVELLGMDFGVFTLQETGRYGYPRSYRFKNIAIYFGAGDEMGYHLEMTGQGCRQFELMTTLDDGFTDLFQVFSSYDVKYTRLDLAVDDLNDKPYFTLGQVISCLKRNLVTSRFRSARRMDSWKIKTAEKTSETVYFGSTQSDMQVRFYDKGGERRNAGHDFEGSWIRTELQLRDSRADMAVYHFLMGQDVGTLVRGVLKNYIGFKSRPRGSDDTNLRRLPNAKWYDEFLDGVEFIKLTKQSPKNTIETKERWLDHSVNSTLALVAVASMPEDKPDNRFIRQMLANGLYKINDDKIKTLNLYRSEIGLQPIAKHEIERRIHNLLNTF